MVAAAGDDGAVVRECCPASSATSASRSRNRKLPPPTARLRRTRAHEQAVSEWLRAPEVGPLTCAVYLGASPVAHRPGAPRADASRDDSPLVGDGARRRRCCTRSRSTQSATERSPSPTRACVASWRSRPARRPPSARGGVAPARRLRAASRTLDDARGVLDEAVGDAEGEMLRDIVALIEVEYANLAHAAGAHRDDMSRAWRSLGATRFAADRGTCSSRSSS